MSLLSRLSGGDRSALEQQMIESYSAMWASMGAFPPDEARAEASKVIAMCKEQGKAQGTYDLPPNFGDMMVLAAEGGEPKSKRIVDRARQEGATDDDIKEWWNLPDLERRMVTYSENVIRYAAFLDAREHSSDQEAAACVHSTSPIYGTQAEFSGLTGEKRPLPHELRGRVDRFRERYGARWVLEQAKAFPSFNAYVRHALRQGIL